MWLEGRIMLLTCPYCEAEAKLIDSKEIYGRSYGMIWICRPCGAYVGTHKNSNNKPLGRLANAELREWKIRAHAVFDPMWKKKMQREECSKSEARKAGYKWLAKQIGIDAKDCHIGMFDVETCKKVVDVCML